MQKNINFYKNQLKEKKREIEILKEISEAVNYRWDLKQILGSIIKIVSDYLKSDSCFIYLAEGDEVVLQASQNPHRAALGRIKMKIGEGITGWVAEHRQAVVISSRAYQDKRFKFFNTLPEDRFEAFLSAPIITDGKMVGVINIQHRQKKKYDKSQIAFIEVIARQVVGAIEYARLLSETNLLREALETRKVVERAKGILMKKFNLTESEAHKFLNKKSMDKRRTLKEVAEAILLSEDILA